MSLRLFVSHSTALEKLEQEFQKAAAENRELDAEAVRRIVEQKVESDAAFKQGTERLYGLLTEAGCDTLLDYKRLRPGNWQEQLYIWIGLCHGAVVLLSERARQSIWVAREVNLLMYRRSLDPDFEVVPVALDGLNPQDFSEGIFRDSGIAGLQWLQDSSPEAIRDFVKNSTRLARQRVQTPLERVAAMLSAKMSHIEKSHVRREAEALGIDLGQWDPGESEHDRLATRLLQKKYLEAAAVLRKLGDFGNRHPLRECVVDILPPLLADSDAALQLARIYDPSAPAPEKERCCRAAALSASTQEVARLYLMRAYWDGYSSLRFAVPSLETGENYDSVVNQILTLVVEKLFPTFKGRIEDLRKALKSPDMKSLLNALLERSQRHRAGDRVFVLWNCGKHIPPEVFKRIQADFPLLRFFIFSRSPEARDWLSGLDSGAYLNLEPDLEESQEIEIVLQQAEAEGYFTQ
jgi:hypothetical protein